MRLWDGDIKLEGFCVEFEKVYYMIIIIIIIMVK